MQALAWFFCETMSHLVDQEAALHFIHHYQRLLVEVAAHPTFPKLQAAKVEYLELLTQARGWMLAHPHVLSDALAALRKAKKPLPDDVEQSVRSMRAGRWVYLRETAHYSILLPVMAHERAEAYAVKSLTTRLRDMTGSSGLVLQTALMNYAGGITTDGLVGTVAYLGSGYRESYGNYVAQARQQGQFYQKQLPALPVTAEQKQAVKSNPAAPRKTAQKAIPKI